MKIFPGLPTPVDDEVISSWFFRCSMNQHSIVSNRVSLRANPDWNWDGRWVDSEDPDFDFDTEFYCQAVSLLGIDAHTTTAFFKPRSDAIVSWDHRCLFCAHCLRDDVASGRLPAWRKSWCYVDSIQCRAHRTELVTLRGRPTCSKAWDAFVQTCNAAHRGTRWDDERFVRVRSICLQRIERWLSSASGSAQPKRIESRLFRNLFDVFLQLPTRRSNGGVARTFFNYQRALKASDAATYWDSLFHGAEMSDACSRFGCFMLLAILLELMPISIVLTFVKYCENANVYFPNLCGLTNVIYLGNVDREEYKILHAYLGKFPRERWPLLHAFLSLQEDRYCRAGVFNGTRIGD